MAKRMLKTAAFIMAVITTLTLTACGSGSGAGDQTSAKSTDQTAATDSGAAPAKEKLKPVTLRFYFPGDKPQATDDVWKAVSELTKDTLNAEFEINFINWNDYKDKLKLLQSSGDNYDLNFDANWEAFTDSMNRGGYLDITDLLPKYAPKLNESYIKGNLLDPIKINGRIYAAPWTVKKSSKPIVWYRGDLAQKGGYTKDKITTIEDFDEYLYAAKKADPQITPETWRPGSWETDLAKILESKYEYENLNFEGLLVKINDPKHTVIPWEQTEAFREYITYVKKWNDDGIIPKNLLAQKGTEGTFDQGTLSCGVNQIDGGILVNDKPFTEAVAAKGATKLWSPLYPDNKYVMDSPMGNAACINKNAANPERTIMFLELLSTDKTVYDAIMYGIKDKTYAMDGDSIKYLEGQGNGKPTNYLDWAGQWGFWRADLIRPDSQRTKDYWTTFNEWLNKPCMINSTVNYFVPNPESIKTENAKREQIYSETGELLSSGIIKGDPEKALNDYIAKQKAAGTDAIVAEVQKQLDAYMAGK